MDIDSSTFDAKRYVLSMLKQNTIKQLIRRNNEIDEEIKTHDHEIQSLVFENYSKFISSIETVREMKDNICMVDDKLKVLEKSMDKISELALKIDSTFSVKRKQIQKLDTINKDLEKLKNLCEFPNVLKQDIAQFRATPEAKYASEADTLFNKAIASYEACYSTLVELKEEPLIAPIYKESVDKVQTMRSTLKALQVQFNKNKMHSGILRSVTKKLLIITDDQVSVLRIYLHSWKQRFAESCFKSDKKVPSINQNNENGRRVMNELINSEIPEINQGLWKEFNIEFNFIYSEVYPRLTISKQQIQLHISSYAKQIFNWALNHYCEAVPLHCTSLKGYIHVNHFITNCIRNSLQSMRDAVTTDNHDEHKLYQQLKSKMQERFQGVGVAMLNHVFSRIKLLFMLEMVDAKKNCESIVIAEDTLKESYSKILNPLKDSLSTNFKLVIDDMEHMKNSYQGIFTSKQKYQQQVHRQIETLIRFLGIATSCPSFFVSEQLSHTINPSYTSKLPKNQKTLIENTIKDFASANQSGCWYIVSNSYLNSLVNNHSKKIIQSTKNLQIELNWDYAQVFTFGKVCLSKNMIALADHFTAKVMKVSRFEDMLTPIQDFMDVLNIIFADSKRSIMKKPSFMSEENASVHETEILTVKKLHLIDRKYPSERNAILTYFIRKMLKQFLITQRRHKYNQKGNLYYESDVYCLIQICYELSNVEQEGQISAFYHLMKANWSGPWTKTKQEMQEVYSQSRKALRAHNIFK